MLRFDDGVEIDVSGDLRALKLQDGWYVVGKGMCLPVKDLREANKTIKMIDSVDRRGY